MSAIYVSALGQLDNIGDSILRRAYLDVLRTAGTLHVLAPDDDGYVSGLGLRAEDVCYRSRDPWRRAVLGGAVRGHSGFALNAGEATLDADFAKYCGRIAAIAVPARLRGSKVVIAGSGFRPGFDGAAPWTVRMLARRSAFVSWRDDRTRRAVGAGSVSPDWAFGLGQSSDRLLSRKRLSDRHLLAVSLRAAGPLLTPERCRQIKDLAAQEGLDPVVLVQVRRDNELAETVANSNGFRCLPWYEGSHLEREAFVRSVYSRSRYVISNRVHALILGLTEGAIPLAPAELGAEKSALIFAAAGMATVTVDGSEVLATRASGGGDDRCFAALADARLVLRNSARQLVDAFSPKSCTRATADDPQQRYPTPDHTIATNSAHHDADSARAGVRRPTDPS